MTQTALEETNPFAALIAQAPETVLDSLRKKTATKGPSSLPNTDPIIAFDRHSADEDIQISLQYRQPSFSSLDGDNLLTKAGETVESLPNPTENPDPVIVFDSHSSDPDESIPIGLTVRQPSFVSLHGELIPKGSGSLKDFVPVLEEVEAIPAPELDEEDEDPQVKLVQELSAKHAERWKHLGYEPPEDLVPLARAASQAMMQMVVSVENGRPSSDTGPRKLSMGYDNRSAEMMRAVIEEEPAEVLEIAIEEFEELGKMSERLSQVVHDEELRRVLISGDVESVENAGSLRFKLKGLVDITADKFWVEESAYLNDLIAKTGMKSGRTRRLGFNRDDAEGDIQKLTEELRELEEIFEQKRAELKKREEEALAGLDSEYLKAAGALDARFQDEKFLNSFSKPSKHLLELRDKARKLLKTNQVEDMKEVSKQIEIVEKLETQKATVAIRDKYHLEDQKMKEDFASRREIILEKFQHCLDLQETEKKRKSDIIHNQMIKLRAQQPEPEAVAKAAETRHVFDPELAVGTIAIEPPPLKNREHDIDIIIAMSQAIHDQKSPRRAKDAKGIRL